MKRGSPFIFWSLWALAAGLLSFYDPWYVPLAAPMAGDVSSILSVKFSGCGRMVEYRRRDGVWYIYCYKKDVGEKDNDPYRLSSLSDELKGGPSFSDLTGHKDPRLRLLEGANALMDDFLDFLFRKKCARRLNSEKLDLTAAGLSGDCLKVSIDFSGDTTRLQCLLFGEPAPTGAGIYFLVHPEGKSGIIAASARALAENLANRRFTDVVVRRHLETTVELRKETLR